MTQVLEQAYRLITAGGKENAILNCLIIVLSLLIIAFCLFLIIKNRKGASGAHGFRGKPKTTGLFKPKDESSTRVMHSSTKAPRR